MSLLRSLKAGIPVSLSGQFHLQGTQALAGIQAWADDVNQAGGISMSQAGARPVSVIYYDDASELDRVRQVTQQLITRDQVDLLFGPYSSVLAKGAAEIAEAHQRVIWNQGGASDSIYQQGFRWVVGTLTPASEYLAGLFPLVRLANPEASTLGLVRASTGAFPRDVCSGAERAAAAHGFDVVLRREYRASDMDLGAILDEIKLQQPDVLVSVGRIGNDLDFAAKLAQREPSLGTVAVVAAPIQQFQEVLGENAEGFVGPSQWEPVASFPNDYGPSASEVLASLTRRSSLPVDYPMVQAYAAGLVAQACVEQIGDLDQRALREMAGSLDISTFFGRFKVDPATGRQTGRSGVIIQWQRGSKVVVWPPELKQAELVYPWR